MTIAVTGALGQLGREFCRRLGESAIPLDLPQFDITDPTPAGRILSERRPDAVINCAAYTMVDQAEEQRDACFLVNAEAVAHLAKWCRDNHCTLVQISTDFVFGGDLGRRRPYVETDPPAPQGVYARSKLLGETNAASHSPHLIIRTCGLYGLSPRNNNFVEAMLRLGSDRKTLSVVDDHHCTPSYVADVARAVIHLLRSDESGIFHVTNSGVATWCEFAREIFSQAGMDVQVEPITTEQYGAAAPRPRYSVLDTSKYASTGGPDMPPWRDAVERYLRSRQST